MNYQISASILSADFARLGEDVQNVLAAGADCLHFDAMDNHFVPNLTIGPLVCAALREYGITAAINIHLMAKPIDRLIGDFAKAGATSIIIHPETSENLARDLEQIRNLGCRVGLALNPETTPDCLPHLWDKIDSILVMSVHPGFAGQTFIPETLEKIKTIRNMMSATGRHMRLGVDGGVKITNIAQIAAAGADTFVSGSTIFKHTNYRDVISEMRKELENSQDSGKGIKI